MLCNENKEYYNTNNSLLIYGCGCVFTVQSCENLRQNFAFFFIYHNRGTTCIFYHRLRREKEKPAVDFKRREKWIVNERVLVGVLHGAYTPGHYNGTTTTWRFLSSGRPRRTELNTDKYGSPPPTNASLYKMSTVTDL